MTKIQRYVDQIDEELCGAKDYAECYIEFKVKGNSAWATRYKEMALDELKHAGYIHERAVKEIEELETVYKPPEKMVDAWNKSHEDYVERAAWIKQMLAM